MDLTGYVSVLCRTALVLLYYTISPCKIQRTLGSIVHVLTYTKKVHILKTISTTGCHNRQTGMIDGAIDGRLYRAVRLVDKTACATVLVYVRISDFMFQ